MFTEDPSLCDLPRKCAGGGGEGEEGAHGSTYDTSGGRETYLDVHAGDGSAKGQRKMDTSGE